MKFCQSGENLILFLQRPCFFDFTLVPLPRGSNTFCQNPAGEMFVKISIVRKSVDSLHPLLGVLTVEIISLFFIE